MLNVKLKHPAQSRNDDDHKLYAADAIFRLLYKADAAQLVIEQAEPFALGPVTSQ